MYFDDMPITKQDDDLLNRRNFAKKLGNSILNVDAKNGLSMGLYGAWGSGKSSVINMVVEEMEGCNEDEFVVMYFNPWNFSSADQLLHHYFIMLADKFSDKKTENAAKLGEAIREYSQILGSFGHLGKVAGVSVQIFGKIIGRRSVYGAGNLTKQRDKIIDLLAGQKQKLIIIIDDIDRLSNEEIKLIFQLVNSVAKFPNTIYLLSFDKEIVSRALSAVQNYDGDKYLEKIIQVPINIPNVAKKNLWKILFDKLDEFFKSHDKMKWDTKYWDDIFTKCVSGYILNIRDIVRLINTLSIKIDSIIDSEINYVDMIGITVIENHLPKLYEWIRSNKPILTGEEDFFLSRNEKSEAKKERIKNQLIAIGLREEDKMINILSLMFPYFASKVGIGYFDEKELRKMQRMGHPDKFDLYFSLDVDSVEVMREEFEYAIYSMIEKDLKCYILKMDKEKRSIAFFQELAAVGEEISPERAKILIKVLFDIAILLEDGKRAFFSLPASDMATYRIRDLFLQIKTEDLRYNLLVEVTEKANQFTIQTLANFLNTTELAHGRLAAKGKEKEEISKIISLKQLHEYEGIFLKRLKNLSEDFNLLRMKNTRMILYLFKSFDEIGYREYMEKQLAKELNILLFVSLSSNKWVGGAEAKFEYNDDFKELVSNECVEKAIKVCIENGTIFELDEDTLQKIAAYSLWREERLDFDNQVVESDINDRIEHWRR